jgi:acyl-CoA synthetase (AMP-forming)/AMP-acid ligase II
VQAGRRISFGEFFAAVRAAGDRLAPLVVQPGDRVMLLAYNSPDWVLALWAVWSAGAVPVLGNRWWSDKEAQHSLKLVRPRVVITDAPGLAAGFAGPVLDITTLADCFGADSAGLPDVPGPADEEAPAVILFTSGSTGMPKAVELPFRSVVANQQNVLARSRQLPPLIPADGPQPVTLVSTPLFHIGAFATLITQTLTGGRIVFNTGRFDPAQVLTLIESERVQRWGAVPTMAARLLEHPAFDDQGPVDADGDVVLDGRSKDMVIRGGENIACPHVEAALMRHPDVVEAAALGLPHPELGEELAAVVVHRPGGPIPSEADLSRHMAGEVAYFAIPTRWIIREQPLPTIGTEKLDKRSLAEEFE